MRDPWIERSDASFVEIDFEGFDAAKQDAQEANALMRGSMDRIVVDDDDAGGSFPWRRHTTSNFAVAFVVMGLFLGYGLITLASSMAPPDYFARGFASIARVLLFLTGFFTPMILAVRFLARRPVKVTFATERYTFRLDTTSGFSISASTSSTPIKRLPLASIASFEGERRLWIVKTDGTREALEPSLIAASRHPELAARLNEALLSIRASVGGYRGVRIAQMEEHDDVAASDESREIDPTSSDGPRARRKARL